MIPINPEAIGDPNQTPVVYIGAEAGKALGIRDSSPPSPAQRPDGQTVDEERAIGRANAALRWLMADQREQTGSDWLPLSVREHFEHDVPALLADLDAAREQARVHEQDAYHQKTTKEAAYRLLEQASTERNQLLAAEGVAIHEIAGERDAAREALTDARATYQELATEFERLRDEADRMRPVVEAARAARRTFRHWQATDELLDVDEAYEALDAAVDTYETQEGTDG